MKNKKLALRKQDIIRSVAAKTGKTQAEVAQIVNAFLDEVADAIVTYPEVTVYLQPLGVLYTQWFNVRSPKTDIKRSMVARWRASKKIKQELRKFAERK
jgi:nucleoid DNA-binding protein